MADSQKTEQPTQRRLNKAREEGRFPASREFVAGIQFLAFVTWLNARGPALWEGLAAAFRSCFSAAFAAGNGAGELRVLLWGASAGIGLPLAEGGAALVASGLAAQLAVTRFGFSAARLKPQFSRLSPLAKVRELWGQNGPLFLQSCVLLPLFVLLTASVIADGWRQFALLPLLPASAGARLVLEAVFSVLTRAAGLLFLLGAADLYRQRRRYDRDLKMSKQEIREEMKEVDGNPQVKARIRRMQRDVRRRRMMRDVPSATAVVVNPTHFSVALLYDADGGGAPRVVAKGRDYLALRIRHLARTHDVPVIENPPLARALYRHVQVGQEIPPVLYKAVAEVLAYVYRTLHGRRV